MVRLRSLAASVAAAALAACGGGSGTDAPVVRVAPTTPATTPAATSQPITPTSLVAAQNAVCVAPSSTAETVALPDTGGLTASVGFASYFAGAAACANVVVRTGAAAIVSQPQPQSRTRGTASGRHADNAANAPILSMTVGDGLGSTFNRTSAVTGMTLTTDPNLNFPDGTYDAVVTNTVAGVAFQQSLVFTASHGVLTITAGAPAQFGALGTLALYAPGVVPPGFELFTPLPTSPPGGSAAPVPSPTPTPTIAPTVGPTLTPPSPSPPPPSPMPSTTTVTYGNPCTATEPLPGTYTSISSRGTLNGSTYVQSPDAPNDPGGRWEVLPWADSGPTQNQPIAGVSYTVYYGTYVIPAFSATDSSGKVYNSAQTTGCIGLFYDDHGSSDVNTHVLGDPNFTDPNASPNAGAQGTGVIAVSDLTRTSGSGTIRLDNGVTGTIRITGSATVTSNAVGPSRFRSRVKLR